MLGNYISWYTVASGGGQHQCGAPKSGLGQTVMALWDLRFSHWHSYRIKSSGMWCCFIGRVINDILKDCCALNFRFMQSKDIIQLLYTKDEGKQSFKTLRNTCPVTWCHNPEVLKVVMVVLENIHTYIAHRKLTSVGPLICLLASNCEQEQKRRN